MFDGAPSPQCGVQHHDLQDFVGQPVPMHLMPAICRCGAPFEYVQPLHFHQPVHASPEFQGFGHRTFVVVSDDDEARSLAEKHQSFCRCGVGRLRVIDWTYNLGTEYRCHMRGYGHEAQYTFIRKKMRGWYINQADTYCAMNWVWIQAYHRQPYDQSAR